MRRWLAMPLAALCILSSAPWLAPAPLVHAEGEKFYIVAEGDSLSAIAFNLGVDDGELARLNGLKPGDLIYAGQKLILPAGANAPAAPAASATTAPTAAGAADYTVAEGDSLGAIAARHGVDPAELARANNLKPEDIIFAGQQLTLPPGARAPVAAPATPPNEHLVADGDTLGGIAARYQLSLQALADANGLGPDDPIFVGQKLKLPPSTGGDGASKPAAPVPAAPVAAGSNGSAIGNGGSPSKPPTAPDVATEDYVVRDGDTPSSIGRLTSTLAADLLALNGMKPGDIIFAGQKLKVPVGTNAARSQAPARETLVPSATPSVQAARLGGFQDGNAGGAPVAAAAAPRAAGDPFDGEEYVTVQPNETLSGAAQRAHVLTESLARYNSLTDPNKVLAGQKLRIPHAVDWLLPVQGVITTFYGGSTPYQARHEAVDIAVPEGTPVKAAKDGKVTIADWAVASNPRASYGLMVVIQHDEGYTTVYGHLSRLRVSAGQVVKKGQIIADSGNTGLTTGPHVHVELRRNNQNLDILKYSR
jgi:murein DD-endopeptidase MepM/ murein hydrolase activator NlpD